MNKDKITEFVLSKEIYSKKICSDYKKMSKAFLGVGVLLATLLLLISHVIGVSNYQMLIMILPCLLGVILSFMFGTQYDGNSKQNALKVDAMAEFARFLFLGGTLVGLSAGSTGDSFYTYYVLVCFISVMCIPMHICLIRRRIKRGKYNQNHYNNVSSWLIFIVLGISTSMGLYGNKNDVITIFASITPFLVVAFEYTTIKKYLKYFYAKKYSIGI